MLILKILLETVLYFFIFSIPRPVRKSFTMRYQALHGKLLEQHCPLYTKNYLGIVDYHSKFPVIKKTESISANSIILACKVTGYTGN